MLFLDHTQVEYRKLQNQDKSISVIIYNNNVFVRKKAFPKEELEAAIKECREEYLDHEERSQIATLLVKEKNGVGIWMQSSKYKSKDTNVISKNELPSSSGSSSNRTKSGEDVNRISIRQIALQMRSEQGVEIKTRRHKIKLFQRCFLGNEAVDWIIKQTNVSRKDAVIIGQKMMDKNIIQNVTNEHQFKDEKLFYRFNQDEGKSIWNSDV